MTRNRTQKAHVRAQQAAAGVPYSVARRRITTLAEVLHEYPELNSFGIGAYDARSKSRQVQLDEIELGRQELLNGAAQIFETASWLDDNIAMTGIPTVSSYTAKHVVEDALGRYVGNGELIAAALMARFPMQLTDSPNPVFGMSENDITRLSRY